MIKGIKTITPALSMLPMITPPATVDPNRYVRLSPGSIFAGYLLYTIKPKREAAHVKKIIEPKLPCINP